MSTKKRISIIGCGTIGTEVALSIKERFSGVAQLVAVCEIDAERKKIFDETLGIQVPSLTLGECVENSDLIVESANLAVVPDLLRHALLLRRDVLLMSVGGILTEPELLEEVRAKGIKLFVPSGAIGGVDLLKSANIGKIYSVELITKKPVEALLGAPYLEEARIDLEEIIGEKVIFEGKASDAIKAFPQNVNVAATLSLAGIGPERTRVKIVTSRSLKKNIHEIAVEGDFGRAIFVIENEPSHKNPKTSQIAAYSAISTLEKALCGIELGT